MAQCYGAFSSTHVAKTLLYFFLIQTWKHYNHVLTVHTQYYLGIEMHFLYPCSLLCYGWTRNYYNSPSSDGSNRHGFQGQTPQEHYEGEQDVYMR